MSEDTEEQWLGVREASREFDVAISYLYKLAYDTDSGVETRIVETPGKIRREVQFSRSSLERWQENRPERFKRKNTPTRREAPGRQELAAMPG